jgi:hypothetical protein
MTSRLLLLLLSCLCLFAVQPATSAEPAASGGVLLPGWQAVAEQALGDIRTVAMQMHPDAPQTPDTASDGPQAKRLIDAFLASAGRAAADGAAQAREQQLIDNLWQTGTRDDAMNELAAERVARGYVFASAEAQLGRSVYGGPAGGAAYAAWWAYRQPGGTAQQAVRVGLLAGQGLWEAELGSDPQGAAAQMVHSTSLAAALGGVAVAAAGGDEQALRAAFFDSGAAVLLQDGAQLYCFSARVQCQNLPAVASASRAGRTLDSLQPVAPGVGMDFPAFEQGSQVPTLSRGQGSLALDQGWTLNWQMPQGVDRGVLYPTVVLTQAGSFTPPPPTPPVQTVTTTRVICERGADSRTIWLLPADPKAGYVCRAMYQVAQQTPAILWNAQQNPEVCAAKAEARAEQHEAQGYTCRKVAAP